MTKNATRFLMVTLLPVLVAGCASTESSLKRETSRAVNADVDPDDITISGVDRGMTEVKWRATTPSGDYKCSADDMLRRVNCIKVKTKDAE